MTYSEIKSIASKAPKAPSRIGHMDPDNAGVAHPLWAMLDARFPPHQPWNRISGSVRAGILRIAEKMHERDIPYGCYVNWLAKFDKGHLKRRPLSIVGYKPRKDGTVPVFMEFLLFVDRLLMVFADCPEALQINDRVYTMYPESYKLGPLKFMYSIELLQGCMNSGKFGKLALLVELSRHEDIESFWHAIGDPRAPAKPVVVDLSDGVQNLEAVHILGHEMKVRAGVLAEKPNLAFDRYFKSDGKLNAQGLKVITGERPLKKEQSWQP